MSLILIAAMFFGIWPFSSSKQVQLTASSSVPAATGHVKVDKDKDNGNTDLDIFVDHLAKPASLTPSASVYIVWVRNNGGEAIKQGEIRVNNDLKGELKAATVSKDFNLLITAEQSSNVSFPSGMEVLHAHIGQ